MKVFMDYFEEFTIKELPIRLAISWLLVIGTVVKAADDPVIIQPTDEIVFQIRDERGPSFRVSLHKVDSYLANENVPVWLVEKNQPEVLIPANEMMTAVGPTIMYQNSDLTAAAIYFHQSRKFYGTIDIRFIFNGVSIDRLNEEIEVQYYHAPGLIARHPDLFGHRNTRSVENDDYEFAINATEIIGEKLLVESQSAIRSRRDLTDIYYVKVLLIVNHDLLDAIKNEFAGDIGIVSTLLTLLNSVDMLYSKLQDPIMRINIAGIIVSTDYGAFPSHAACYKRTHLDMNCINSALRKFLERNSEVISPDSYNVPIFLTSFPIAMDIFRRTYKLEGLTSGGWFKSYVMRKSGYAIGPLIGCHNQEYFGSFPVIAHEIAHALRVRGHDSGPFSTADGECCASLMKPRGLTCKNCLKWSAETKRILQKYFTSRERCFHIYKPPSLQKPGPRVIQTADAQCECYGYESAGTPKRTTIEKVCRIPLKKKCETALRCYDLYGGSHDAPFPLDGTPCDEDADGVTMVCWAKKCIRVANHEK